MKIEFGIMSSKWSIEAENKLTAYAAIVIYLGSNGANMVMLYNEELKDDVWAFSADLGKRLNQIFGCDFFDYIDTHTDEIKAAINTIIQIV